MRAALPTLCTYSDTAPGGSNCRMEVTSGKSRPRAATSVQSRTAALCFVKVKKEVRRLSCDKTISSKKCPRQELGVVGATRVGGDTGERVQALKRICDCVLSICTSGIYLRHISMKLQHWNLGQFAALAPRENLIHKVMSVINCVAA